jgi:hypothetical protein
MKKGTRIKLKDGKYELFCKDKEYLVFAKITQHKDGTATMYFSKGAVFSSKPEHRHFLTDKIIK